VLRNDDIVGGPFPPIARTWNEVLKRATGGASALMGSTPFIRLTTPPGGGP
jgi:hypothetical protein